MSADKMTSRPNVIIADDVLPDNTKADKSLFDYHFRTLPIDATEHERDTFNESFRMPLAFMKGFDVPYIIPPTE